ncbi:Integrase catalytic domain-containing protein [Vespula squamosa]|uniref:Integrase catalytic domain-containing protein n=1 Tax=Vespula squamosa TaxID=30214 RepID=A0ABD2BK21_VESSQ
MVSTNQYPGINSREFKEFLEERIPLIFTAINSAFSNGLNERLNQIIIKKSRCGIKDIKKNCRKQWDFKAEDMIFAENNNKLNRKKLDELKIDPYKTLQKLSDSIYKTDTGYKKAESKMFHITKPTPAPLTPTEEP